jgi:hypothetical protein
MKMRCKEAGYRLERTYDAQIEIQYATTQRSQKQREYSSSINGILYLNLSLESVCEIVADSFAIMI